MTKRLFTRYRCDFNSDDYKRRLDEMFEGLSMPNYELALLRAVDHLFLRLTQLHKRPESEEDLV